MSGPLASLRVLDYCWVGAGALVTKLLADHGAEVIKIESVKRPDNLRLAPPYRPGTEGIEGSGYFASRNSSKKSFALNMSHPEAPAIARRLAAASSIVTSNFRPGIMERWGLAYETIAAFNPSVIYLSMPMQGNDGPGRAFVGFGSTISALSGLVGSSGLPGRTPVGTGTHYPDHVPNPGHALVALLAAVYRRELTGQGQSIEVSQFESTVNMLGPDVIARSVDGLRPPREGNRSPQASPSGVFPVDGVDLWCAISVESEAGWASFADVLRHREWATDARFATLADRKANEDDLDRLVVQATRVWSGGDLVDALQAHGIAAALVETSGDLMTNPQLTARGFWDRADHPVMGNISVNRAPFRSSLHEGAPRSAAPLLGQHTRELAASVLGIEGDDYDDLVAREVFA